MESQLKRVEVLVHVIVLILNEEVRRNCDLSERVMILFAMTRLFWLSAVLLFGAGACMVMVFATLSSLVQLNAPNEMRGRVMSLYMVAFRGGMPLGSLVGGWLANMAGAPAVLSVNGLLLSTVAIAFLVKNRSIREL